MQWETEDKDKEIKRLHADVKRLMHQVQYQYLSTKAQKGKVCVCSRYKIYTYTLSETVGYLCQCTGLISNLPASFTLVHGHHWLLDK